MKKRLKHGAVSSIALFDKYDSVDWLKVTSLRELTNMPYGDCFETDKIFIASTKNINLTEKIKNAFVNGKTLKEKVNNLKNIDNAEVVNYLDSVFTKYTNNLFLNVSESDVSIDSLFNDIDELEELIATEVLDESISKSIDKLNNYLNNITDIMVSKTDWVKELVEEHTTIDDKKGYYIIPAILLSEETKILVTKDAPDDLRNGFLIAMSITGSVLLNTNSFVMAGALKNALNDVFKNSTNFIITNQASFMLEDNYGNIESYKVYHTLKNGFKIVKH